MMNLLWHSRVCIGVFAFWGMAYGNGSYHSTIYGSSGGLRNENTMQYMITKKKNKRRILQTNCVYFTTIVGTTVGAAVCHCFITFFNTRLFRHSDLWYSFVLSIVFVVLRNFKVLHNPKDINQNGNGCVRNKKRF